MLDFSIVVAHDKNRGIGKNNDLVWNIPEDMSYFKQLTTTTEDPNKQNIVIMGRKTYESIPSQFRPLSKRHNIIISSSTVYNNQNVATCTSIESALKLSKSLYIANQIERIFCIGGSQLYQSMIKDITCTKLYITMIHDKFDCDCYFPEYTNTFSLTSESAMHTSTKNNISYSFQIWKKST